MQAASLKQFVSAQRKRKDVKDGKAAWLLEQRSLSSQTASLEQDMQDMLGSLHRQGHISAEFWKECLDDITKSNQLLLEEASESKEAAKHIHLLAKTVRAHGDCYSADSEYLMNEISKESELQDKSVHLLEEDMTVLSQELKCAAVLHVMHK
jgi:hypothetical protein